MIMINKAKYLSLLVLLGAWGCANQNVSRSGGSYDDLYGGNPNSGVVTNNQNYNEDLSRTDNPDYRSTQDQAAGTSDYYDDSYLSSRGVQRTLSPNSVGYNAGFADGYSQASNYSNFNNGFGSYWPGSAMSLGMSMGYGMGSMFSMRPYLGFGFGMGSMMGMGYSPFGFGSMMGYSPFGYGSSFGYSPFGYGPYGFGNSMYGYGGGYGLYDSYYGGGYGYNPWAYNQPVIVVNNNYDRQGLSRTYGPRSATSGSSRGTDRYNSGFVNNNRSNSTGTTSDRGSRRSANSVAGSGDTYSSPRSSSSRGNSYSGG